MKMKLMKLGGLVAAAGLLLPAGVRAQGTAITYQGQLYSAGAPANGNYDVAFGLWTAATGPAQVAGTITNAVVVSNGLYLATMDFGAAAFNGSNRWLEIAVRTNGGGAFYTLTPRLLVTPAPAALYAANAGTATTASSVPSGNLTGPIPSNLLTMVPAASLTGAGTLPPSVLPARVVTNGEAGVSLTGTFSGNGCYLTNLNGAGLIPGTVTAGSLAPGVVTTLANALTQSGYGSNAAAPAAGGIILSPVAYNTNLANAGYVKIFGSFNTPESWQVFTNPPVGQPPSARNSPTAVWTGTELLIWGGHSGSGYLNDGGRYNPAVDSWTALPVTPGRSPAGRVGHSAVWTGSAMLIWGGLGATNYFNDGGYYDPLQNAWTYIPNTGANTPAGRLNHTAVWSGGAMIVWGGKGASGTRADGGLYNPSLQSWTALPASLASTPSAREGHTAVWTGTRMIVWGGDASGSGDVLGDGGIYDPVGNAWTAVSGSAANSPAARESHTAVWTGSEMLVWGGAGDSGDLNDGGRFNPVTGTWLPMPGAVARTPGVREQHTAVWTGTEMMVWGGYSDLTGGLLNDGGRYNPTANSWTVISNSLPNTPGARYQSIAVWSGTEMIVWGGAGPTTQLNDGGRYNPASDSWTYLPGAILSTPAARSGHTAVWTGSEMLIWGGVNAGVYFNDGGRFNPALNAWAYVSGVNAPSARSGQAAVWTGTTLVVWGGVNGSGFLGDGGVYNPVCGCWSLLDATLANSPGARANFAGVWTGARLVVWGGLSATNSCNDGGLLDPVAKVWTAIPGTLANTPAGRASASAVWTGTELVVWGGVNNGAPYADGGRYNPAGNIWTYLPNTLANTPAARSGAAAVWTGAEMVLWGGAGGTGALGDGGRYNPAASTWTAVTGSLPNSPAARSGNTAVWTGTEMVIWGGQNGATYLGDGGRYDPALNAWTYVAAAQANEPAARAQHTAVWTGSAMLVWGGGNAATTFNDTVGYTPGRVLYLYQHP